jgi:hypothetical protein
MKKVLFRFHPHQYSAHHAAQPVAFCIGDEDSIAVKNNDIMTDNPLIIP